MKYDDINTAAELITTIRSLEYVLHHPDFTKIDNYKVVGVINSKESEDSDETATAAELEAEIGAIYNGQIQGILNSMLDAAKKRLADLPKA